MVDEVAKGGLAGVGGVVKHGFASEEAVQADAIDSAGELVIHPALDAVGMAGLVKTRIGGDELWANPSAFAAGAFSAGSDDFLKRAIDGVCKTSGTQSLG